MNFTEILMGNVTVDQTNLSFKAGNRQIALGNNSNSMSFDQILGSRMNDTTTSAANSRLPAAARQPVAGGNGAPDTPLYKTYRQARKDINRTEAKGQTQKSQSISAKNKIEKKDDSNAPKAEEATKNSSVDLMQILAQMLGVDREKLNKLLAEGGISPEELGDLENVAEASAKISSVLGLDEVEAQTLAQLLEIIRGAVTETSLSQGISEVLAYNAKKANSNDQATQGAQGNTFDSDNKTGAVMSATDTDQLLARISEKLEEYTQRLMMETDTVESEIKSLMEPLFKKSEAIRQNILNQYLESNPSGDSIEGVNGSETNKDGSELQKEEMSSDNDGLQMKDGNSTQEPLLKTFEQNDEKMQHIFATIASDNSAVTEVVDYSKTQRQTVPAREILGQIIEKAGVVISQDRSEMLIELKPESLGRISLKVVTENGIVMAKFVAENQHVQQVLETNMQMLKDSMQKQGINIQNISVSVRQEGNQSSAERSHYENSQRTASGARPVSGARGSEGVIPGFTEATAGVNPYLWESSTINLTA